MDEFTSFLNLIKRSEAEEQGKFATDFAENMAKIDNAFSSTKQKLDDIDAALNGKASTSHASTHITGGTDVIPDAVAGESSGLMSGADKQKLDDATATDTASTLVMRDDNKRAKFADPAENQDAATKKYVDDSVSEKANKVSGAVAGNLASLDASGNLQDSGKAPSDFALQSALDAHINDATKHIQEALTGKAGYVVTVNDTEDGLELRKAQFGILTFDAGLPHWG